MYANHHTRQLKLANWFYNIILIMSFGKGGEKEEFGDSQEGCPLAFPYLASAHLISKGGLKCSTLLTSIGVHSFHLF